MTNMEVWLWIAVGVLALAAVYLLAWIIDQGAKWQSAETECRYWRIQATEIGKTMRELKKIYTANFGLIGDVIADLETVKPADAFREMLREPEAEGTRSDLPPIKEGSKAA